jgi:hypothetical protein
MDDLVAAVYDLAYAAFEVSRDVNATQQAEQPAGGRLLQPRELLADGVLAVSLLPEMDDEEPQHRLQQVRAPHQAPDGAQQRIDALVLPRLEPGADDGQVIEGQRRHAAAACAASASLTATLSNLWDLPM